MPRSAPAKLWISQADSDWVASTRVYDPVDHRTYCQTIARFQQVVEKCIKAMAAAVEEAGIATFHLPNFYLHSVRRLMSVLLRLPQPRGSSVQDQIGRFLSEWRRTGLPVIERLSGCARRAPFVPRVEGTRRVPVFSVLMYTDAGKRPLRLQGVRRAASSGRFPCTLCVAVFLSSPTVHCRGAGVEASSAPCPVPAHLSLIVNGSGAMTVDGIKAANWEPAGGKFGCAIDADDGRPVLRIADSAKLQAPFGSGLLSGAFAAYPGLLYRAGCEARLRNATGETYLTISWYGPTGWIANTEDSFRIHGNWGWTKLEVADYPPSGATYGRCGLRSDNNPGTADFRNVRVWIELPREDVDLALPASTVYGAPNLVGSTSTPCSYALGELEGSGGKQGLKLLETRVRGVPGQRISFALPPGTEGAHIRLWKHFEKLPEGRGQERLDLALVEQFLRATRWLLPVWLDEAAREMFGGREQWMKLMGRARGQLDVQGYEKATAQPMFKSAPRQLIPDREGLLERYFALALTDLWNAQRADDADLLRKAARRCEALIREYPDVDVRADQLDYLSETAKPLADRISLAARAREANDRLRRASPQDRWDLLLARSRIHWDANDYSALLEDAGQFQRDCGKVHPLVVAWKIGALFRLGRLDDAEAALQAIPDSQNHPYARELVEVRWLVDLAAGRQGPRPQFVGDEEDADGYWPGRFGTEGLFLIGPQGEWVERGVWEHHDSVGVSTGYPGVSLRAFTAEFPSTLRHAVYFPRLFCQADAFMDDRGEIWGKAIEGPDILVRLPVPAGAHRLSLLTSGYETELRFEGSVEPIASAPLRAGDVRLYRQFLVFGPASYELRLRRGDRLMTYLSGVFLDAVGPAVDTTLEPLAAGRRVWEQFAAWEQEVAQWPPGSDRLLALTRKALRPTDEWLLSEATALMAQQIGNPVRLAALLTEELRDHPAALHAMGDAISREPKALSLLDIMTLARGAKYLARFSDLRTIERLVRGWAHAHQREAVKGLRLLVYEAVNFEPLVAALRVLQELGAATAEEVRRLRELKGE